MRFRFITTQDPEYSKELMLRWEVLRKPLGLPPESAFLPEEKDSMHLIALEGKEVVGCVLFHPEDASSGKLYHMAVSEEYRGRGFGRKLIVTLEQSLIQRGFTDIHLYARAENVGFYEQLGYNPEGETIEKEGITRQFMKKQLGSEH